MSATIDVNFDAEESVSYQETRTESTTAVTQAGGYNPPPPVGSLQQRSGGPPPHQQQQHMQAAYHQQQAFQQQAQYAAQRPQNAGFGMGGPPQQPGHANPAEMLQSFGSNPLMQSALSTGWQMADSHLGNVQQQVSQYVNVGELRYYFKVDTYYVLRKLGLLLFPFLHKDWERSGKEGKRLPPREDFRAPDLYIPVMAFVTYVLVIGVALGTTSSFTPEALGYAASSALVWLCLETLVYRAAGFLTSSPSVSLYELVAYTGYKYMPIILLLLLSMLTKSSAVYWAAFLYLSASLAFFTFFSLSASLSDSDNFGGAPNSKVKLFALAIAALQPLFMLWFSIGHSP